MSIGLGALTNTISSKLPSLGKVGNVIKNNKMNTIFLAMSVIPALAMYKSSHDSDGNQVEGTNWSSGNKAVGKAIAKFAGFTIGGGITAALACGVSAVAAPFVAAGGLVLSFTAIPKLLEKIFPDEGELIKEACAEKGIAYTPPSLLSSGQEGEVATA